LNLGGRHVDQDRVIADLRNHRSGHDDATDIRKLFLQVALCSRAPVGLLVEPQLDLEADRRVGVCGESAPPECDGLGGNPILWAPWPEIDQT
jgi:hypothetical protein